VFHNVVPDYKHLLHENKTAHLNGLVQAHKNSFFYNSRYSLCAPHGDTAQRYNIQVLATHASIFFTDAMIRAFRSARSRGNFGQNNLHEMQVAQ